jgi:small subunit ribosomal protein S2
VKEAARLNIPVIAMVDTCCDPTPIDYVIPANDDATKSIELIMDVMCQAINEGLEERKLEKEKEAPEAEAAEAPAAEAAPAKKLRARRTPKAEAAAAPAEEAPKAEETPAEE